MNAGDTFLAPGFDDHLWMVISDPVVDPEQVVIVFFLTWQPQYDPACIVQAGEHPFVKHATCVEYPAARITTNSKLDENVGNGRLKLNTPLSTALLQRIRERAGGSDITSQAYAILRQQGLTS